MAVKRTKFLIESQGGDVAERALNSLGDSAERASKRIGTTGTQGSAGLKALDAASRSARDSIDGLARRAGPVGDVLTSLGTKGTIAAGGIAAATIGIGKATTAAVRFQSGLIGVGKTTDLEGQQLARLGDRIGAMSVALGEGSDKLLATAQAAGQLGVRGVENIALFTETVAKLGTATDLSGEEAATSLARLLTITGEGVDKVGTLANVIVRLGNNFAATESEIADTAQRIAGTTAAFDVSSAQAAAYAATIRQIGEESEAASTQIGKAYRSMASAISSGGEPLRAFAEIMDTTVADVQQRFGDDATGAVLDFIKALGSIPANDLEAQLDRVGLAGDRGNRVFGNLSKNVSVLFDAMQQANAEVESGTALQKEFNRRLEAAETQTDRVRRAFEETGRVIGDLFVDDVTAVAKAIADLVERLNEFGRQSDLPSEILNVATALHRYALSGGPAGAAIRFLTERSDDASASLVALSPIALSAADDLDTVSKSIDAALSGKSSPGPDASNLAFLNGLVEDLDQSTQNYVETVRSATDANREFSAEAKSAIEAQLEKLDARLEAFRSGGLGALAKVTAEQERQAKIEGEIAKIVNDTNVPRERAVELATALVDKDQALKDSVAERKQQLKDLQDIADEASKAAEDAQKRLERRQEQNAEDLRRRMDREAELLAKPFVNAAEGIQSQFSSTIEGIVRNGKLDFKDFGNSILDIFAQTFAQVATLRLGMPIIQPLVGGVAGLLGLPASAQGQLSSALPGGGGLLGNVGSLISGARTVSSLYSSGLSGITGAYGTLIGSAGTPVSAIGSAYGYGLGGATTTTGASGLSGLLSGNLMGGGGLGAAAGIAGGAGLGGLAGAGIASLLGERGNTTGGAIGGALGGAGATALFQAGMVGGPVGIALALAAGLIGSLAGGGANNAHLQSMTGGLGSDFNTGAFAKGAFGNVGLANRGSDDVSKELSKSIAEQLAAVDNAIAEALTPEQIDKAKAAVQGKGVRIDANQSISEGELSAIFLDRFQTIFDAIDEDLPPALAAAAKDLQHNNPSVTDTISAGVAALQEAAAKRIQKEQDAAALKDFQDSVHLAILQITDPVQAALEQFDKEAQARLDRAKDLGANLADVERLTALQRQKIIEQSATKQNDALEQFLFSRTATSNSYLSAPQTFTNAQQEYSQRLSEVLTGGGDRTALASAADNLLQLGRERYGSSQQFQALMTDVINQIQDLVSAPPDAGMAEQTSVLRDIGAQSVGTNERLDQLIAENKALRAEMAAQRQDLQLLRAQGAARYNFSFDRIGANL